jgi:glycine C-acetyltransferase
MRSSQFESRFYYRRVRLCKGRYRYENSNMEDLEQQLIKANNGNVSKSSLQTEFSMDGVVAPLIRCDLADKYDALVMIDERHATGFIGATGKGTS